MAALPPTAATATPPLEVDSNGRHRTRRAHHRIGGAHGRATPTVVRSSDAFELVSRVVTPSVQTQSGIESKSDELMADLAMLRTHCEDVKNNLETQVSERRETYLRNQQAALVKAEMSSNIKITERAALTTEVERMSRLCEINIASLVIEMCALSTVRRELEKMKGDTNPAFFELVRMDKLCKVNTATSTASRAVCVCVRPMAFV